MSRISIESESSYGFSRAIWYFTWKPSEFVLEVLLERGLQSMPSDLCDAVSVLQLMPVLEDNRVHTKERLLKQAGKRFKL